MRNRLIRGESMKEPCKNRVLMLLENQPYPQDHRVRREAVALARAGYAVTVICPASTNQVWREVVDRVQVYRFRAPVPGNGFWGYAWEYGYCTAATFLLSILVLFRHGFEVVHAHNPPETFVFIGAFYKLFGKRFIFDHHDLSPEMYRALFGDHSSKLAYRVLILLERLTCRLADHIIATNESYKQLEIERHNVSPERITVVRNGVEVPRRSPASPDRPQSRGKTIIAFLGVMGFQDGVDYLLRALHHLRYDLGRRDFHCVCMGDGAAWSSSVKLAQKLRLDEHVWFPGPVHGERLLCYLSSADICVDPDPANEYNNRCTMIKMMEYMAYAKPIVAFDLPEHRVTAQDAALYVKPNDEMAFAAALAQLMGDPVKRKVMGAIGRHRIETKLAWRYSVPNLLAAYRKVLPQSVVVEPQVVVRPENVPSRSVISAQPAQQSSQSV
jgi:glycosyltransferase involved in cell wall biosynthesis